MKKLRGAEPAYRTRALDRIARHGDSPERLWNGASNLVDTAARAFEGSEADYRSPLWGLLSAPQPLRGERIERLKSEVATRLGLWALSKGDSTTLTFACGPAFPGRPGAMTEIERGADVLAQTPSLDAILLLAIQIWDAVDRLSLSEGQLYLDALGRCCSAYDQKFDVGPFTGMIYGLVLERIVRQRWDEIHPRHWPYFTLLRKKAREDALAEPEFHNALKDEYGLFGAEAMKSRAGIPLLPLDPQIQWLIQTLPRIRDEVFIMASETPRVSIPRDWFDGLIAAGAIWPAASNWVTLFVPPRVIGPLQEGQEE